MPRSCPPGSVRPIALCLGGMDPSAGAGLLRDVMTLATLGIHPMAIATAETIQNGQSCTEIRPPGDPLPCLEALAPHLAGARAWGAKLGLCALDEPAFAALSARVAQLEPTVRIWDPILAPTAGVGLHSSAQLRAMARILLGSGGWVVSPNLPEAAAMANLGMEARGSLALEAVATDPQALAAPFLDLGASAVWLKGGHSLGGELEDFWITPGTVQSLGRFPRLPGERRGTGCTLASAWLGYRLLGLPDIKAAVAAARFLRDRWEPPVQPGGYGRPCFPPGAP